MTDNEIGTEGAKGVSEMLEVNTTLTSLNLSRDKDVKRKSERKNRK